MILIDKSKIEIDGELIENLIEFSGAVIGLKEKMLKAYGIEEKTANSMLTEEFLKGLLVKTDDPKEVIMEKIEQAHELMKVIEGKAYDS